ncbi:MAG: hypothetical protein HQ574_09185, partial [Chloroflexi bacterium]|nr:hypothetical protein [Chloroflexota bacterium]
MNTDEMSKEQLLNKLVETRRQVSELEEIELKFKLLVDHTFDWEYW